MHSGRDDPRVAAGRQSFVRAGCAACHVPELRTALNRYVPAGADQPYLTNALKDTLNLLDGCGPGTGVGANVKG